jgi:hypothetical protein
MNISVIGITGQTEHDESVKTSVLTRCATATVTIRANADIQAGMEQALAAGDDVVVVPYDVSDNYFTWTLFRDVIDALVAAGAVVVLAEQADGDRVAQYISVGYSGSSGAGMWCYDTAGSPSNDSGLIGGSAGQLLIDHAGENNFDVMARIAAGCARGLGGRQNAGGWGLASYAAADAFASAPLMGPVNCQAEKSSNNQTVTLTWQNIASGTFDHALIKLADGTTVYSGTAEECTFDARLSTSETFKFYAVDGAGNVSALESYHSVAVTGLEGAPPTGLTVDRTAALTGATLAVDAMADATAYKWYRSTTNVGEFALVGTTTLPAFSDTELVGGQSYVWKVAGYSSVTGVEGGKSGGVSGKGGGENGVAILGSACF